MTDFSDRTRDLSPELQDEAARLLLLFVGDEGPTAKLTPEEAGLAEADAEIARGEFTT